MSKHELKDKDGKTYLLQAGAGPKWPDRTSLASCSISAEKLLERFCHTQLNNAMFSVSGHLANQAALCNPCALPIGSSGMRLVAPCAKRAINDGLSSNNLVIHQLGTTEIETVEEDERAMLRVKIRQGLSDIITAEKIEAANLDAVFQQEDTLTKGLIVTGAGMTGFGNAAWGLLCWAKEASDLVNPVVRGWNQYQAAKSALGSDNFASSYVDNILKAEKRELVEAMGFDPSAITMEQLDTAMEVADLIWSDSALQTNLTQFCKDYISAQHLTEQAEMLGGAVFEILLTIILAAVTGGVGAVASLGSKARLMGKFRKVGDLLMEFAKASKQAKKASKPKGAKANKAASFSDLKTVPAGDTSPVLGQNKAAASAPKTKPKTTAPEVEDSSAKASDSNSSSDTGTNDAGKACQKTSDSTCLSDPINMVTGEELLELDDFTLSGPLPFTWRRTYRSTNSMPRGLGIGWAHPASEQLDIRSKDISFIDAEGRNIPFARPALNQSSDNHTEKLKLTCIDSDRYIISAGGQPDRIFTGSRFARLEAIVDSSGNRLDFHYRGNQLAGIQSSWGPALGFEWQRNCISRIDKFDRDGVRTHLASYHYNFELDMVACEDGNGHREQYQYRNHVITKRTLKTGFSFHFEWDQYNPQARCTRQYGDGGFYDYRFEWDDDKRISRALDGNDGAHEFHYDENGRIFKAIDPEGGATLSSFDEHGNLLKRIDPGGAVHSYEYNSDGLLTRYRDPVDGGHSIDYRNDRPVSVTDAMGNTWSREYYDNGLVRQLRNPQGLTTDYVYNDMGLPSEIRNPAGQITHLQWDEKGRLVAESSHEQTTRYRYNNRDQIESVSESVRSESGTDSSEAQVTRYGYDSNGNILLVTYPDGRCQKMAYNANDQLISTTDPAGRTTRYKYDGLAQVRERIDANGQSFKYEYDNERNLSALINQKGERYQLKYDRNERLIEEIGFDGRVQQYHYNKRGQLSAHIEGLYKTLEAIAAHSTRFERDALGRLLSKRSPDGELSQFAYDTAGRLTKANNGQRQLGFEYSATGQMLAEIQDGQRLSHHYNKLGLRTETQLPSGETIGYQLDEQQRLSGVSFDGQRVVDIERDAWGREIQRFQGATTSEFDYDLMGRISRHSVTAQSGKQQIINRGYGYDDAGNLALVDDFRKGATHYQYDALNQLKTVKGFADEEFDFDPAGNLLSSEQADTTETSVQPSSSQVKGNRLLFHGDRKFSYDAAGNLIRENRGKNGSLETRYRYNSQNQLIAIDNGKEVSRYTYDALGRRISKEDVFGKTDFLWNGDVLLSEKRGQSEKIYLYELGSFRPLAQVQDGNIYHYHLDHLGTPQEMTDNSGAIVWSASYKAYGNLALQDVDLIENNLRFQGQYFDSESGLHYNRHRYYNPNTSHFITADPIGLNGGANNYLYVPNPTGWVDPFGLASLFEVGTYGSLNGGVHVGDNLQAHELIRHEFLRQEGLAGRSRLSGNPSIALDLDHHTRGPDKDTRGVGGVHHHETQVRAENGLGPNNFKTKISDELDITSEAMRRAGVPEDKIAKLRIDAEDFYNKKSECP